jgi:hypothetical protein
MRVTFTDYEIDLICNALATAGNRWSKEAKQQESEIYKSISEDMWALNDKVNTKRQEAKR